MAINTHGMKVEFGKHKGELYKAEAAFLRALVPMTDTIFISRMGSEEIGDIDGINGTSFSLGTRY